MPTIGAPGQPEPEEIMQKPGPNASIDDYYKYHHAIRKPSEVDTLLAAWQDSKIPSRIRDEIAAKLFREHPYLFKAY